MDRARWEGIGGRKFIAWVTITLIYLLCIIWGYAIKDWGYLNMLTPHYFVLTGVYLGVNVWQKKIQNGQTNGSS